MRNYDGSQSPHEKHDIHCQCGSTSHVPQTCTYEAHRRSSHSAILTHTNHTGTPGSHVPRSDMPTLSVPDRNSLCVPIRQLGVHSRACVHSGRLAMSLNRYLGVVLRLCGLYFDCIPPTRVLTSSRRRDSDLMLSGKCLWSCCTMWP